MSDWCGKPCALGYQNAMGLGFCTPRCREAGVCISVPPAHEYPPCTGQCCQGLAVASERLDAAQKQLYEWRENYQKLNAEYATERDTTKRLLEELALFRSGRGYWTNESGEREPSAATFKAMWNGLRTTIDKLRKELADSRAALSTSTAPEPREGPPLHGSPVMPEKTGRPVTAGGEQVAFYNPVMLESTSRFLDPRWATSSSSTAPAPLPGENMTAREFAHGALGDKCGERWERFGHTKECDFGTNLLLDARMFVSRLGAAPTLDPGTIEACARIADEWARDGAGPDSKLTGRSIAGRIRSLAATPGTPPTCGTCEGRRRVLSPMDGDGPPETDPCPDCTTPGTPVKEGP